ncbi:MAG: YlxR family protein [Bifidobacteriaceae bacterium]|nr:YlxR family protein [Bifidobacteriaceae bacterium]
MSAKLLQAVSRERPPTPVRTCVGCRQRDARSNLARLALDRAAVPPRVVVDRSARLAGRGAWVHWCHQCVDQAIRRGNLARAFKRAVDVRELKGLDLPDQTNPSKAGGEDDGHTMSAL